MVAAAGEPQVYFGEWPGACEGPLWSGDACGLLTAAKWWRVLFIWGVVVWGSGAAGALLL